MMIDLSFFAGDEEGMEGENPDLARIRRDQALNDGAHLKRELIEELDTETLLSNKSENNSRWFWQILKGIWK